MTQIFASPTAPPARSFAAALLLAVTCIAAAALCGCSHGSQPASASVTASAVNASPQSASASTVSGAVIIAGGEAVGFDRNDYPGDAAMAGMHRSFAFAGYWLNNPPGENVNTWAGKRELLKAQGWGFLALFNGRLDAEILKAQKAGTSPAALGRSDAGAAVAAAKRDGFPAGTIVFLDQEEGGRLLDEQAGYLLAWTEAVAVSGFRAGVYASGQPVPDDPGTTIDTIRDIRARVAQGHLHPIAMFDAQDACPPAPGCTLAARPLSTGGEPDLVAWQYAQSPRRPEITKSCAKTYAADNNCYAPGLPAVFLDIDTAASGDPSHGR